MKFYFKRQAVIFQLYATALIVLMLQLSACATPLKEEQQQQSFSLKSSAWEVLQDNLPSSEDVSWFDVQAVGPDALRWRLALIDTATTSIDAQYFIWEEDAVGSLLLDRLLQAADRGVRVRMLIDDSFLAGEDQLALAADAHPNLELRIFNPFEVRSENMLVRYVENLNDYERTNHRMHNKLLISDGQVAVVGGRNIAEEYFGFNAELNFRDFDLMVTGKVVPDISNSFDLYWNSGWAYPVAEVDHKKGAAGDLDRLQAELKSRAASLSGWLGPRDSAPRDWSGEWRDLAPTLLPGRAKILQDNPHFEGESPPIQAAQQIVSQLRDAQQEVMSVSAYLVPSAAMIQIAAELSGRGVDVKALTNSLASNNHVPAHSAYRHHRKELLLAGVDLYELKPDAPERSQFEAPGFRADHIGLHAKILVLDRQRLFVGTINADPRSMVLNTEVSLMIDSPELAEAVISVFSSDFQPQNSWRVMLDDKGTMSWHSSEGVLDRQPSSSTWRRLSDSLYGMLPIDDQM